MDVDNIEDLRLPQAVIARLIKEALPPNVSVSKANKVADCKCFIIWLLGGKNCDRTLCGHLRFARHNICQ